MCGLGRSAQRCRRSLTGSSRAAAMRADAPSSSHQRHLYVTDWRQTEAETSTAAETARMLVLDDGVLRSELALKLSSGTPRWPALVCAIATQRRRRRRWRRSAPCAHVAHHTVSTCKWAGQGKGSSIAHTPVAEDL